MLKAIGFLLAAACGAAGATAWLLSDTAGAPAGVDSIASPPQDRLQELQGQWQAALQVGRQAGKETEERLHRELVAYRNMPSRASGA